MILDVVFENKASHPTFKPMWGFACYIPQHRLLFDTGSHGAVLLNNMKALNIDPKEIETIVLSHFHWDHAGGLLDLLQVHGGKRVYLHSGFSRTFAQEGRSLGAKIFIEDDPITISPGIITTGALPGSVTEQGLLVRSPKGWVLLTGCAHPGIVTMVEEATRLAGEPLYLVIGGFHLPHLSPSQAAAVARKLLSLGVNLVAPCHCTGEKAIETFAGIYGPRYLEVGAGTEIPLKD